MYYLCYKSKSAACIVMIEKKLCSVQGRQTENQDFHFNLQFDKTQNHDLFISPKRKKAVLEMSIKSSIMSKLDHQMSII